MAAVEVLVLCDVLLFNALFSLFTLQSFLNKVWKKTMPASRVVRFFKLLMSSTPHLSARRGSNYLICEAYCIFYSVRSVGRNFSDVEREIAKWENKFVES